MKRPLALFLLALLIRLAFAAIWQFDGLYGQDAFAYFDQGAAILHRLPQGQPPPTNFFWPNGYPLLIALFMAVLGQTAVAAQLPALLTGAALAPIAYLLAVELFPADRRAGLLAGLIVAVAGQPILSSVSAMADMPALFWAGLAALLAAQATRPSPVNGRPLRFFAAGLTLGLAIVSRWLFVLVAPALVAFVLYRLWSRRTLWPQTLAAVGGGLLVLLPQVWLSLNRPETLLHSWLLGWHPANALRRQFINPDGHFFYELPVGLFYAQPAGHPAYIFPLLGLAALWAIWRLALARQWGPLLLLLGWTAVVYTFLAGIPYQNFRFGLTHYLPLVVLAGWGLSDLWVRLGRNRLFRAVVLASLMATLLWAVRMNAPFLSQMTRNRETAQALTAVIPPDAPLITFGLTQTVDHYTDLAAVELFLLDEAEMVALINSGTDFYLLVDPVNLAAQWQGFPPQQKFDWLAERARLTEIGRFPPFVLYQATTTNSQRTTTRHAHTRALANPQSAIRNRFNETRPHRPRL